MEYEGRLWQLLYNYIQVDRNNRWRNIEKKEKKKKVRWKKINKQKKMRTKRKIDQQLD